MIYNSPSLNFFLIQAALISVTDLSKNFSFSNYRDSVEFSNNVDKMADKEDHHPVITIEWGKVTVVWWSHKIKGLHKNDFICAAKTDQLNNY